MKFRKFNLFLPILTILFLSFYSCDNDKLPETCGEFTDVSFSGQVLPVLNVYCTTCHNSTDPQGGVDQSSWAEVKTTVDSGAFLGSIKHEDGFVPMPLNSAQMNTCEILLLETWVNEGALDN